MTDERKEFKDYLDTEYLKTTPMYKRLFDVWKERNSDMTEDQITEGIKSNNPSWRDWKNY